MNNKIRYIFLIAFLGIISISFLNAQQVKIGTNYNNIKPSALLELEDTNQALLLTRVFNPNISIKTPWKGMIVFDSTINKLAYYNGADWIYAGDSKNIYNTDGTIENTTSKKRTINRKNNLIVFLDSTQIIASLAGDQQMKTYDTITFGQFGRLGIGTTDPKGKLDVRGPIYIYADHTNNSGFNDMGFGYFKNPLPAFVIQPDTIAPITTADANSRTIFMTIFNRKYPNLYPGVLDIGTFNAWNSNTVAFKEGRVDLGFLGNSGTDSNLFTIWNRSTNAGGVVLRTGTAATLRLNNGGQIGITTTQFPDDTAALTINSTIPQSTSSPYWNRTDNRYPILVNVTVGKNSAILASDAHQLIVNSKLGILFTQSYRASPNNLASLPEAKMGYLWTANAMRPAVGISTYFTNTQNGFSTTPYPDLPSSNLYEVVRFYVDQPYRGSVSGLPLADSNYKYQQGVSSVKITNMANTRYSKLAFSEQNLATQWQFMKMGQTPITSSYFLPSIISKNANDFYLVKDSTEVWMQFLYAGNKIIFLKDIDVTSAPNIISDQRIKKIKNKVEQKMALEKINAINIVDYTMKKDTTNIKKLNRGVIAQEVEKIFPEAVTTSKTTHPLSASNIEEFAESFRIDSSNKKQWYVEIMLPEHGLKKEDKLYLKYFNVLGEIAPNYLQEKIAEIVDKDRFKLPYFDDLANAKKMYIIGQEIKDLKTVDYSYLNMTNIAATQEMSKQLDEANKKIKTLEDDVAELKKTIKKIAEKDSK